MRITCPNCGAQYEVPDEVIPAEGRDVQCSNCGDTWYQNHPDHAVEAEADAHAEPVEDASPEPDLEAAPETPQPAPVQRELDPEVAGILQEEAAHEAKLRSNEAGSLESQAELGLDSVGDDEASRRSREARERMARMRGEDPTDVDHEAKPRPRSALLPNIDEINSTLRAEESGGTENTALDIRDEAQAPRGGFARGFSLVLIVAVLLILAYTNSARISATVPALTGTMETYVGAVDKARIWLDGQLSGFIPQ